MENFNFKVPSFIRSNPSDQVRSNSPSATRLNSANQVIDWVNGGKKTECVSLLNTLSDDKEPSELEGIERLNAFVRLQELTDPSHQNNFIVTIFPSNLDSLILTLRIDNDHFDSIFEHSTKVPLGYLFENYDAISPQAQNILQKNLSNLFDERQLNTFTDQQQRKITKAFMGSQDSIVTHAKAILANFDCFEEADKGLVLDILPMALKSKNTSEFEKNKLLSVVLNHLEKFPEQQEALKNGAIQNRQYVLDHATQCITMFDQFSVDQQCKVLDILSDSPNEIHCQAKLFLENFDKLSSKKQDSLINELFNPNKLNPSYIDLIANNLKNFSADVVQKIVNAILQNKKCINTIAASLINNLHVFTSDAQRDIVLAYPTELLNNFKHATENGKRSTTRILCDALTTSDIHQSNRAELCSTTLNHLAKFSTKEQDCIKSEVIQNEKYVRNQADLFFKLIDQFNPAQQTVILNILLSEAHYHAESFLAHFDKLSNEKRESIVSELIHPDKFNVYSLNLLIKNLEKFSKDVVQQIADVILKQDYVKLIDVPIDLALFSPVTQRAFMTMLLKNPSHIETNAGQLLERFSSLTEEQQLTIDKHFSKEQIAEKCGLECQVPAMSVKEKLLSLAMLNFYKPLAKYEGGEANSPVAARDSKTVDLIYAVYRPNEPPNKEPVLFKANGIKGLDVLKVLNGGSFDVKSLFGRVGYHTEQHGVVFSVMHPVICHLMQCNPFFMLNYPDHLGTSNRLEARKEMTRRHEKILNQPTYDAFMSNQTELVPLLKQIYEMHGQTLMVMPTIGQCRNRLT